MKTNKNLLIILSVFLIFASCKKKNADNTVLDLNYTGWLTLYFSNDYYPEFTGEESVDVDISKDGTVTFGTGVLTYSGEEVNTDGDGKIKREGTINIAPSGTVYKNAEGDPHLSVDENSTINENTVMWVKNNAGEWDEVSNTDMTDTWNGGLDFDIDLATIDGASSVEVNGGNGKVKWSLYLLPKLTK